jgi:hypothetical protein
LSAERREDARSEPQRGQHQANDWKLETVELKDAKIVLKASPSISLRWKEKVTASAAVAS